MSKRQTNLVLQSWVEALNDVSEKLSKWELSFVESIADKLNRGQLLSERQEEILESLYARHTP